MIKAGLGGKYKPLASGSSAARIAVRIYTPEGRLATFVEQRLLLAGECATATHPGTSVPSKMAWRQVGTDIVPWRFGATVKLPEGQEKPPGS